MEKWFCNLTGLLMTQHKLAEAMIEVNEAEGKVILECRNGASFLELKAEDVDVLEYAI